MSIDPATLRIVTYPAKVLRTRAHEVPSITDEVRQTSLRMIELMHEADGVGLAAPQVGLSLRLFVVDVPPGEDRSPDTDPLTVTPAPIVYINPVLSDPEGTLEADAEGCLSLPNITGEVMRAPIITIKALGLDGKPFTQRGAGLLARCWQHEMDHLDGVLILDRMSQISRIKARRAIRELERATSDATPDAR